MFLQNLETSKHIFSLDITEIKRKLEQISLSGFIHTVQQALLFPILQVLQRSQNNCKVNTLKVRRSEGLYSGSSLMKTLW